MSVSNRTHQSSFIGVTASPTAEIHDLKLLSKTAELLRHASVQLSNIDFQLSAQSGDPGEKLGPGLLQICSIGRMAGVDLAYLAHTGHLALPDRA